MICKNCGEEMSTQEDIGYDYTVFTYLRCYDCGNEVYTWD